MKLKRNLFILFITLILCSFPIHVRANDISHFAYYDPSSVSFRGTYNGTSNYYDGNYMAFESTATASDGKSHELIISIYIVSTNTTKQYRIYTDGKMRKADHIPIGNGSSAVIRATCSDSSVTVKLDLKMYSW